MVKKYGNIPLKFAHHNKEGDIKQVVSLTHTPASHSNLNKRCTLKHLDFSG